MHPHGWGTSVYRGERHRRYSTSSSPSGERHDGQSSPLAIPLHNGRSNGEVPNHTTPEFRSQSRDSSVERPRDRALQPSTSGCSNAGLGSMRALPSEGANAGLGSMLVPPARNGQSLESNDSDDEGSERELSGEVRSILSSRENVRHLNAMRADVTVHGNPNGPVDLHGDIHPENRQKRVRSRALVQSVTTVCHDSHGLVPRRQETSPIRHQHVREGHAPMRTQPNSELPHFSGEPVITRDERRVPRDDSRRGRKTDRDDDERLPVTR